MDNINLRYLKISIPVRKIKDALIFLKKQTKVSSFSDAMTLIYFKNLSREENESVSMLITLWRAWKDGEIEPTIDLESMYAGCEQIEIMS
ncbi:MAG: hypothetical protein IBX72_13380 [Nitrospirae bacterium]|nr:hypothetical protein [Nitrospirota bacterium]